MPDKKIFIVISAYNEEKNIGKVIKDLHKYKYRNIVIVDDGSTDNTNREIAKFKNIIFAKHIINRGTGASVQTGNEIALAHGANIIVNIDGDNQHQAKDISNAVDVLIKNKLDIVLGSRYLKKKYTRSIPFLKKFFIHKLGRIFTLIVSRVDLTDNHNGFRVMTDDTAARIDIKHDRFEYCSEIQDKLRVLKLKFKEVPVDVIYSNENQMHTLNKPWNAVNIVFKFLFSKLV